MNLPFEPIQVVFTGGTNPEGEPLTYVLTGAQFESIVKAEVDKYSMTVSCINEEEHRLKVDQATQATLEEISQSGKHRRKYKSLEDQEIWKRGYEAGLYSKTRKLKSTSGEGA